MKLYELSSAWRALSDLCSDGEGEDFKQALLDLKGELDEKVVNTAKVVRELEAHRDALKGEAERLSGKARAIENNITGLKGYLQQNMEVVGVEVVKGDVLSVSVRSSPPACEVVNTEEVPVQFRTSILKMPSSDVPEGMLAWKDGEDRVDKAAIIKLWKAGAEVPGTKITQGRHLRIT